MLPDARIVALTAAATPAAQLEIGKELNMLKPVIVAISPDSIKPVIVAISTDRYLTYSLSSKLFGKKHYVCNLENLMV